MKRGNGSAGQFVHRVLPCPCDIKRDVTVAVVQDEQNERAIRIAERNDEALPPLEQAVKLAATNPLCRLKLGIAYLRVQRLGQAQSELEEAARLDPENAAVHFQLGKLYKQIHALDRAQKEFARAEEIQSRAATATVPKPKQ